MASESALYYRTTPMRVSARMNTKRNTIALKSKSPSAWNLTALIVSTTRNMARHRARARIVLTPRMASAGSPARKTVALKLICPGTAEQEGS